jgi:helix-turn-helix protein
MEIEEESFKDRIIPKINEAVSSLINKKHQRILLDDFNSIKKKKIGSNFVFFNKTYKNVSHNNFYYFNLYIFII